MPNRFHAVRALLARAQQEVRRVVRDAPALSRRFWAAAKARWAAFRADPAAQDRALARTVFAAIFGFFVVSVDYLVTGGPDWNPGAAPAPRAFAQDRVEVSVFTPAYATTPVLDVASVEPADYSFTNETLLGGPDVILASADGPDEARVLEVGFTQIAPDEAGAKIKGVAAAISVSAAAALW